MPQKYQSRTVIEAERGFLERLQEVLGATDASMATAMGLPAAEYRKLKSVPLFAMHDGSGATWSALVEKVNDRMASLSAFRVILLDKADKEYRARMERSRRFAQR